ncbi:LolA family protein [Reichenbachiella versicolor]|uniref:LolA family protein n=1 Tax=Reichenbachiella versicolor TaxID=1821036 RepID=UPI000D6E8F7B|nr:outer membrane lipoprotein carrier protein LolA [Reichenbachiella versicolor]
MKKLITLITLSILVLTSVYAQQQDPKAGKILDAMSAKYRKTPAFKADFSYKMENIEEDINETFEGTVFVKGDLYKLLMEGQEMRFDGKNIWTYSAEFEEVSVTSSEDEEEEISISNIFDLYKTGYKYLYLESKNSGKTDVIDLVPNDLNKSFFKIRMEINATTKELRSFKVFDKSGSKYIYTVKTYQALSTLKDNDFTFSQAELNGKEFIDMR